MPSAVHLPSPGLQALILCGPGSSFPTFTSNPDENPKALLPIANRPMVWYPVDFCYRAGISKITLVCPPTGAKAIQTALNTHPLLSGLPLPKPEILAPAGLNQTAGTADIFRLPEVKELVTSDFLLLPCDLICELPPELLLQAWMVRVASLSDQLDGGLKSQGGGLGVWYETKTATPLKGEETDFLTIAPLPRPITLLENDSIIPDLAQVVRSMPTATLKDKSDKHGGLPVRRGLFERFPRARDLYTRRDAHLYIFPRWIVDFINENPQLESIGEDVLGWWAKAAWQRGLREKLKLDSIFQVTEALAESGTSSEDARSFGTARSGKASAVQIPPIFGYIQPLVSSGPLIRRVDTSALLLAASLQLAKLSSIEEVGAYAASPFAHAKKVAHPDGVKPRTTITRQDSLIGENVSVEEKTSIKECVVGANCQIKEGAKLHQCVLMDGVVVGKACKLTKCILGRRCVIGDGSVLMDCEVQENLLVEPKTEDKDAKLMADGYDATEAEMEQVYEEMEEDLEAVQG